MTPYQGTTAGLGRKALAMIDSQPLLLSAAAVLELELPYEIDRTRRGASVVTDHLADHLDTPCASGRFSDVVRHALPPGFTRAPFDRFTVARAAPLRRPLTHARWRASLVLRAGAMPIPT